MFIVNGPLTNLLEHSVYMPHFLSHKWHQLFAQHSLFAFSLHVSVSQPRVVLVQKYIYFRRRGVAQSFRVRCAVRWCAPLYRKFVFR